jgi:Mg/Co/Ni transporter MgtE
MPDYYEDGKDDEDENDYNDEYDIESPRLAKSTATSAESSALHHGLFSLRTILDRAAWLVGLLVLQSLSGVIIQHSEGLLQRHIVIVRFLTMLVGAGGNAGNQASVRVIRSLAVGTLHNRNLYRYLWREALVGLSLAVVLGFAGCLRAYIFDTAWWETVAISTSLFVIVLLSVLLGATLPLLMRCVGIDPAHSSTTIQVVMDILGVTITVVVSWLVLDSSLSWSKKNGSVGGE